MARGGLGWPVRKLAAKADVSTTTIIRIERGCRVMAHTLEKVKRALIEGGAEFDTEGWVRLKLPSDEEDRRDASERPATA